MNEFICIYVDRCIIYAFEYLGAFLISRLYVWSISLADDIET